MAEQQMVVLHLAGKEYGIQIDKVLEIIRYQKGRELPEVPDYVEGIIDLRGQIYPIINLRKRLRLEEMDPDQFTKIVIVKLETIQVGFVVDDVREILMVEEGHIDGTPEVIRQYENKYINGVARIDDNMLLLLNVEKVLKDGEEEQLKDITDNM